MTGQLTNVVSVNVCTHLLHHHVGQNHPDLSQRYTKVGTNY